MRFPQEQHREHNNWLFLPGDNAIPFFPSAAVCIPNPTVVALRLPFPFDSPANTQIKDSKDQHKQGKSHCTNGNRHLFAVNRKRLLSEPFSVFSYQIDVYSEICSETYQARINCLSLSPALRRDFLTDRFCAPRCCGLL